MPQQVVPVRVIMPKLISAEQCLPVCQQSCGKSCAALFTTAECTPVCRQSCEQRCVHLLPSLSINTCSVECWPKCSQQCIGEQQLLLQQNMQLLDSAGVTSIQEQPILVDQPMLAGDLIPLPQQALAGRAPLLSGPIIGGPAPFQQSIQNHPMLTRGQMAPRGAYPFEPFPGPHLQTLPFAGVSPSAAFGPSAAVGPSAAGFLQPQQLLPDHSSFHPGLMSGGVASPQLLGNQPRTLAGLPGARGIPSFPSLQSAAGQPWLLSDPTMGELGQPKQLLKRLPELVPFPTAEDAAALNQPLTSKPTFVGGPVDEELPRQLQAGQRDLLNGPSVGVGSASLRQPFLGQPSLLSNGRVKDSVQPQQVLEDQPILISSPIPAKSAQPQQLTPDQLGFPLQEFVKGQLAKDSSIEGVPPQLGIIPGESTLISDASSAGVAGQQLPSITGEPSQVSSFPGSVNVPQEASQPLCPTACMPACDPQCIKEQELLSQQPSQAVPTMKAPSRLQEGFGKEFSFGAAKKV
ncbi:hypothetical protein RB195_020811 [Necator americanus]